MANVLFVPIRRDNEDRPCGIIIVFTVEVS